MKTIYPLFFEPELRQYLWGGRNLERLGRSLPPGPVAESWEISGHPLAPTKVASGYWKGHPLPQILEVLGEALAGTRWRHTAYEGRFPLLVKILDAEQDLSVQVHPDDAYTRRKGILDSGKVECWYILTAKPGARLIYGLQPGVDATMFREALAQGRIVELLGYLPVVPGDCVFVPAGTLHAITAGILAVEIQQTSDATFRVYDWGRVDRDGKPRPLHIEQALEVIAWDAPLPGVVKPQLVEQEAGMRRHVLVACPQFVLEEVVFEGEGVYRSACTGETFEIWGCLEGHVTLAWEGEPCSLEAVRFVLLPAALGPFEMQAKGPAKLLRTYLG